MSRRSNIRWSRSFTEHLLYGITGNEMNKKEDETYHQPNYRQSIENALEEKLQLPVPIC